MSEASPSDQSGRWAAPTLGRRAEGGAQSGLDIVDHGEFCSIGDLRADRKTAGGTQQLEAALERVGRSRMWRSLLQKLWSVDEEIGA